MEILKIQNLNIDIETNDTVYHTIRDVSITLNEEEIVGIAGETGCGKTLTCLSILRLLETPPIHLKFGTILYRDKNLLSISDKELNNIRGNKISMIFQEPQISLNPVFTVGTQIAEVFKAHSKIGKKERYKKTVDILRRVGIAEPENRYYEYPHQLSGGMKQRVMIGMSIAMKPDIVIADEPTTALDVTIEKVILNLMKEIQAENKMSMIFISHNLYLLRYICDRVFIMYSGEIVEEIKSDILFTGSLHPYTMGLLKALPDPSKRHEKLYYIKGTLPDLSKRIQGCIFYDRCEKRTDKCKTEKPLLIERDKGHFVRCWNV